MITPVHIAVNQKIHISRFTDRQNLHAMRAKAGPDILFTLTERKYLCAFPFFDIIEPECPVCHKSTVLTGSIRNRLQLSGIGNTKKNSLIRISIIISGENLIYPSVIIHHIDSLRAPFHSKSFRDIIIELFPGLIRSGNHILQLHTSHNALQLL